ncbi:DUF2993 domain-containing protein [Phormidium sp. LEGE 05292]|uniref:LmeA family phospholipid-binding protein n=1 Tax=[Phormidium] sp. LEGE 05292 TaxID=767427 RepID=UPI00187FAFAB|nr:DUF2993 domain-containing protein [Phormidium sp. LEGE 05292]MBE9224819.1 DUF2993 domain-containing protein [Phormidium sp. LEGE 05292]
MSVDQPGLGEQALSKAAEMGLSSQLDEVEELNVDIRTNPIQLMQGELESVSIEGKGLVMQEELRTEKLQMQVGNIAINPLSAAFGKIELSHPTQAETKVVLTEQDIDRAFNSDFLREKLQNMEVNVQGQPVTVDTQKVEFSLPDRDKFSLDATFYLRETGETKKTAFTAVPEIASGGNRISLEQVEYKDGQEISPELTEALLDKSSELLDFSNFELKGMSLRLKNLDVQPGNLIVEAEAYIRDFPSS